MTSDPLIVLVAYLGLLKPMMVRISSSSLLHHSNWIQPLLQQLASERPTFGYYQFLSLSLPSSSDRSNIKEHHSPIKEHRSPIKENIQLCVFLLQSKKRKDQKKRQQSKGMVTIPQAESTKD